MHHKQMKWKHLHHIHPILRWILVRHINIKHFLQVHHCTIVSLKYCVLLHEIYFLSLIDAPPPIPVYIPTVGGFLGHYPQITNCLSCQQQIVTIVRYEPGGATWLIALLICLFGGFLGCCFIPFCVSSCQDAVHSCPSCGRQIGRRNVF